jgi:hypothetical protein
MADDAEAGIASQDALQLLVRLARSIGHDHHPRMDGITNAHPAAVMERHPRRTRRGVQQRVQHRPVGDGIAAIAHGFGLTVRRCHRAGVEMIAPDDDRRADDAPADQVVQGQTEPRALAVSEPEDACRQSLERHALAGEADPAAQRLVVLEHLQGEVVRGVDIGGVSRQRRPAERAFPLAEERTNVLRDEAGELERLFDAGRLSLGADVVAVVEDDGAGRAEREHGAHVISHRAHRAADVFLRVRAPERLRFAEGQAVRYVAVQRVVR